LSPRSLAPDFGWDWFLTIRLKTSCRISVRIQNIKLTLFKLADPSITSYWVISWGLTEAAIRNMKNMLGWRGDVPTVFPRNSPDLSNKPSPVRLLKRCSPPAIRLGARWSVQLWSGGAIKLFGGRKGPTLDLVSESWGIHQNHLQGNMSCQQLNK
jgi:hypothetical protein